MAYLKVTGAESIITRYVSFSKTQEVNLTVQTALDGTEYLTRFGAPVVSYELEVHVNDAGKEQLLQAQDNLSELEIRVRLGTFHGRIRSMEGFTTEYYGWYGTKIVLSAVSEVADR